MAVKDWSTIAANNGIADADEGISVPEGMAPGNLNDSIRALMAVVKGDFANSPAAIGFQKFPNGMIIQWGTTPVTGDFLYSLPIPFPTAFFAVVASSGLAPPTARMSSVNAIPNSLSDFFLISRYVDDGGAVGLLTQNVNWIAIGF